MYNVLTDFCVHKIWIHREVDRYFVATDHVKEVMVDIGVPAEQIVETGIPIRSSFELKINSDIIYNKYQLCKNKKDFTNCSRCSWSIRKCKRTMPIIYVST